MGDGVVGKRAGREEGGAEGGGGRRGALAAVGDVPLARHALRRHPPAQIAGSTAAFHGGGDPQAEAALLLARSGLGEE